MTRAAEADRVPEASRNELLRLVDWRFLLAGSEAPRTLDLASGPTSAAVRLAFHVLPPGTGGADLAVIGAPTRAGLGSALAGLRRGGHVAALRRLPRPGGAGAARSRLVRGGFRGVRLYWPGPVPQRPAQFWLPLDSPAAREHLLAQRPPRSAAQSLLRPLWRGAARAGALAPVWALAAAAEADHGAGDDLEGLLPRSADWLLLTGGGRSINKVVALGFPGGPDPQVALKFARLPESEPGLEREAAVLGRLAAERPRLAGVPRLLASGRRSGRLALAESAIAGRPLLDELTAETFEQHALRLTDWLIDLAGEAPPREPAAWRQRLVADPLEDLERRFGDALPRGAIEAAGRRLEGLGDLPLVPEHRDCSPWNVVLTEGGAPALLDWESAEPLGLPGLDLVYFLANAAFVLDGALESGRTRESYSRLLDPATPQGAVATACMQRYSAAIGVDARDLGRLRALCWVVHCRSDYAHLEMEAAGAPRREVLRGAVFAGLLEEELRRAQEGP